jgi:hypothetical protein
MKRRRYAEETRVPISRSRAEIDRLLREWGADAIQWSDDFRHDRVMLRFLWTWEEQQYVARFTLSLPTAKDLEVKAINMTTRRVSESKMSALMQGRGKVEHRILALWLKAAFNGVAAGIVTAEALFLAFFEGHDGQTMGEVAIPRLPVLLHGSAMKLLPEVTR